VDEDRSMPGEPDPRRVKSLDDLARELDLLRRRAARGSRKTRVSLADLAGRVDLPRSTVHTHVSGKTIPPPDVLDAIVIALGADAGEQRAWAEAWHRVCDHVVEQRRAARHGLASGGSRRLIPRQLPTDIGGFTGRVAELAALDALLAGDRPAAAPPIAVVSGPAGVGKTALTVHWAHRVADRFPDGQLYVNLQGFDPDGRVLDPAEAVRGFLDALDVAPQRIPSGLAAQTALYRSMITGRRMLIVLDNARDAGQARALLPGAAGCLTVVTSRSLLTGLIAGHGARPVTVDLLPTPDARHLLTARIGAPRMAAEPRAAEEIMTHCAGLPLALAIVAARIAAYPRLSLRGMAAELADSASRLDALADDDPQTDVRAVLSWSYRTLPAAEARLFRLLGLHFEADITVPAAASLGALTAARARSQLGALHRANLIIERAPGRYTLHDLLRVYAAELAHHTDSDEYRRLVTDRMLDHYLHTAYAAAQVVYPNRDPITLAGPGPGVTPEAHTDHDAALAWLTVEYPVLLAALQYALAAGRYRHTWQLAWTLFHFLYQHGRWHDWAMAGQAAVTAADRLSDPSVQARAHGNLANAYGQLGRLEEARSHLGRALDLATRNGDQAGQANTHRTLAHLWSREGRHHEALDHATQALTLFRQAGHRTGQARALNAIGWYRTQLGEHRQALTYCQQALALLEQLGDDNGQAGTWDSLGHIHLQLDQHAEAVSCYQRCIDLCRKQDDRYGQATALTHLGDAYDTAADRDSAAEAWRQALAILTDLEHPDAALIRAKLADIRLSS
jgi:tetratricopeptide (TPR) repeat protein